jgi:hypothetical protein
MKSEGLKKQSLKKTSPPGPPTMIRGPGNGLRPAPVKRLASRGRHSNSVACQLLDGDGENCAAA